MISQKYFGDITNLLSKVSTTQKESMEKASRAVANTIKKDGIIYVFGCGHSHLLALDCFYRAGGLANVSAMLDTDLMLHNGAAKSSSMEKMSGIAKCIFDRYRLTKNDLLIVISTSGKNAVPVEMAKEAKLNGIPNFSIVSSNYFGTGKEMLYEYSDFFIDNCVPLGDAVIDIPNCEAKMGSTSTIIGSFILQSVLAHGAEIAANEGVKVPIYKSGNVKGGSEYNKALIEKYYSRIKHL